MSETNNDNISSSYDAWSHTYDTMENPTRDLASRALRAENLDLRDRVVLEIGCGTGRNTGYLAEHAHSVTAMDFSAGMMAHARLNITDPNVHFLRQDINRHWSVGTGAFDLIVCMLVLEHIENLEHIFKEAHRVLRAGGAFFLCELHPYRQLGGGQAQFLDGAGETVFVPAFLHNISEFVNTAIDAGFEIVRLEELSDDHDEPGNVLPRLVAVHLRS